MADNDVCHTTSNWDGDPEVPNGRLEKEDNRPPQLEKPKTRADTRNMKSVPVEVPLLEELRSQMETMQVRMVTMMQALLNARVPLTDLLEPKVQCDLRKGKEKEGESFINDKYKTQSLDWS